MSTTSNIADGNLSRWVSHIQQQHSGVDANNGSSYSSGHVKASATGESTADALEDEVRRAREERSKRRSQLSSVTGGAAGIGEGTSTFRSPTLASSSPSPSATPVLSGEESLRKLLGERGIKSPSLESAGGFASSAAAARSSSTPVPTTAPSSAASQSTKSNALLDRYGGAMGPTGVARAGTHESPVSLASFMGGKASGPRLGKLAGDGRSAPPEAAFIHDSRHALPGLATQQRSLPVSAADTPEKGRKPLASFLEARAAAGGIGRPSASAPVSSSPPKYTYSPPKLSSSPPKFPVSVSPAGYTPKPQDSYAPRSPTRPLSPIRTPNVQPTPTPPIAVPDTQAGRQAAFSASRKDASASPSKDESADTAPAASALSPGLIVHSPTADALARFPDITPSSQSPGVSPRIPQDRQGVSAAFLATQQSPSDRLPTASLTRLRSKKMVEQRVREAQERSSSNDSLSPSPSPAATSDAAHFAPARKPLPIPSRSPVSSSSSTSPSNVAAALSNALPGLGGTQGGVTRNLYAVNRKTPEEEAAAFAAPVRLPGMGSAVNPFAGRTLTDRNEAASEESASAKPLESLTKGRARPPKRPSNTTQSLSAEAETDGRAQERISADAFASARNTFGAASLSSSERASSPVRTTAVSNLSLNTQEASIAAQAPPSRQDSVANPDSATRLADGAAALEALLEGRKVSTPSPKPVELPAEKLARRSGALKIAKNASRAIKVDHSALLSASNGLAQPAPHRRTVSVDVLLVGTDGSTRPLMDGKATLFETETQIIVHRFESSSVRSTQTSTEVYARVGRLSKVVTAPDSPEARTIMQVAQRNGVPVIDVRQGREPEGLGQLLGGLMITREGSRTGESPFRPFGKCMFQVRGESSSHFVDQVDVLTSSLSSGLSVVVQYAQDDVIVWHGVGASEAVRTASRAFARTLTSSTTVTVLEEGREDQRFWTCFEKDSPYGNAWHHRLIPSLSHESSAHTVRLFGMEAVAEQTKRIQEIRPFSAIDVRRDGVFLLQLPLELYVLVGPDARSQRHSIAAMIEAGMALSRKLAQQRGPHVMAMPLHVVIFPTLVPREVRAAFRYWHDEHLNGARWQRMQLRMNVWERREALEQMSRNEYNLSELDDDLFLPVGVGLDDIKGIDI